MTKTDKIIAKYNYNNDSFLSIESMMKEYAEVYARECLKIAANTARILEKIPEDENGWEEMCLSHNGGHIRDEHWVEVDKESILNIELPKHD